MTRRVAFALLLLAMVGTPRVYAEKPTIWGNTKTKTATASGAAADTVLWTPASGFRIILMGCVISSEAAALVELESSDVDVVPPIQGGSQGASTIGFGTFPLWVGAADATLTFTISEVQSGKRTSIVCSGYEDTF